MLAASMNVLAQTACEETWDCMPLWGGYDGFCASNQVFFNATDDFYDCNTGTGYCELSSGKYAEGQYVDMNCSEWNDRACLNGDLYKTHITCKYSEDDGGNCVPLSPTLDISNSPNCDITKECAGEAHTLSTPKEDIEYNVDFDDEYVIDTDGTYVVVPGTTTYIDNIAEIYYYCGNGVEVPRTPNLIVWVYNATSNKKVGMARNNIEIEGSLNREDVIGPSSTKFGTPVLNPFEMLLAYGMMFNDEIEDIYSFNKPSKYTVFIDLISGYCGPNAEGYSFGPTNPTTQNYVCPWLGGTNRANLCSFEGDNVEGWTPMENLSVLVPNPDITIGAPTSEANLNVTSTQKKWTINNTGLGKTTMSVTYDCGNWTCAFVGYTAGRPIPLEENEGYIPGITLDITIDPSELTSHLVGIIVTYDEGYGLKGIPPKTKTSYISLSSTNATTNVTTNPLVSVSLNQPASGSNVPNNITLNYTITGTNNTYDVSLNLNGSADNQTDAGKLNNTLCNFTLMYLNPGVYWWNVTGYINSTVYDTSQTWTFTVTTTTTTTTLGDNYVT
jgi:hypothetical protein